MVQIRREPHHAEPSQPEEQTEAQEFFEETYPFPSVAAALIALGMGDVGIVISMVLSVG
jgi:hypothetical protein